MDKASIRIIMPVELRHEVERIPNVNVVALPALDGIDLSWKDIHNVAAIIAITCGLAELPGHISDIATILTKYAVSQPTGCVRRNTAVGGWLLFGAC